MLDFFIRETLSWSFVTPPQYAYMKGKSTDTVLHEIVSTIEKFLHYKEYTLVIFLDNVNIKDALTMASINGTVRKLIDSICLIVDRCIISE